MSITCLIKLHTHRALCNQVLSLYVCAQALSDECKFALVSFSWALCLKTCHQFQIAIIDMLLKFWLVIGCQDICQRFLAFVIGVKFMKWPRTIMLQLSLSHRACEEIACL